MALAQVIQCHLVLSEKLIQEIKKQFGDNNRNQFYNVLFLITLYFLKLHSTANLSGKVCVLFSTLCLT